MVKKYFLVLFMVIFLVVACAPKQELGDLQKQEAKQVDISEFTVESDDNGFSPNRIKVKVGDKVKINFKFNDNEIYFAGLDIKGPFPDLKYKLKGQQPLIAEFTMKEETRITSWWPSSGVKKGDLIVQVLE